MHTLFVRLHNVFERRIRLANPGMSSEFLFQHTRRFVIAIWQNIVFDEWCRVVLGETAHAQHNLASEGSVYNSNLNPTMDNVFSVAAFRLGHTYIVNDLPFLRNDLTEINNVRLSDVRMFVDNFSQSYLNNSTISKLHKFLTFTCIYV